MSRRTHNQSGMSLVELLVGVVILSIVSTMVIMIWVGLQNSYSYTVKSDTARAIDRDAMARMTMEIRDAQGQGDGQPLAGRPAILSAASNEIRFTTAFNDPGTTGADNVLLTRYYYEAATQRIIRQRDINNNGVFDSGDRSTVVASNIVNAIIPNSGNPTPLFKYAYRDAATGQLVVGAASVSDPLTMTTVDIRMLADLNPAHTPIYMDLRSTIQPRNLRQN